jgi:DNA-binding NarL/FixJ family response regulator
MTLAEIIDGNGLDDVDITIISLVAEGLPNRDIARQVFLSCQTVRNRLTRIFDITATSNRTQLAVMWLQAAR